MPIYKLKLKINIIGKKNKGWTLREKVKKEYDLALNFAISLDYVFFDIDFRMENIIWKFVNWVVEIESVLKVSEAWCIEAYRNL